MMVGDDQSLKNKLIVADLGVLYYFGQPLLSLFLGLWSSRISFLTTLLPTHGSYKIQ